MRRKFLLILPFLVLTSVCIILMKRFEVLASKSMQDALTVPGKLTEPKKSVLSVPETHHHESMTEDEQTAVNSIYAAFMTGDYARCLHLAERFDKRKVKTQAFSEWLGRQKPIILAALGWLELRTGHCERALEHLKRAERLQSSPETAKGLAYCYSKTRNFDAAEERILWLLHQNEHEKDDEVLEIYANVLESQGRYAEAAKTLSSLATDHPQVANKLSSMREKAKRGNLFQSLSTRFFSLTYEGDAYREIAEKTLDILERSLDELIQNFRFKEPKIQIEVVLYAQKEFHTFHPESPLWAEALFDGRIRVPLPEHVNTNVLVGVLRHELVHALFSQMTGSRSLPNWFDEGIAQLASQCNGSCTPFVFPPNPGDFLGENFFHRPFVSYKEAMAHTVYQQSLYLVLTLDYLQKSALPSIIESIKVDSPLDSRSLLQHVGMSFPNLRQAADELWRKRYRFNEP